MISLQQLRRYPYFASASNLVLQRLAEITEHRILEAGEYLFREDDNATHVYVLISGRVDIDFQLSEDEVCIVDTLGPGDLMSWSGILPPHRATGSCKAHDRIEVLAIDAPELGRLCEASLTFGYGFMREIATTLRNRLRGARVQLAVRT